ncbi:MAG: STAS domain-containing protein [Magnetococcales bacterium]|nr:STAS domain-containing protein [Magnetococcales bacterium]
MTQITLEVAGETATLTLAGDMTIQRATLLKGKLLEALTRATHVALKLEHVSSIDLSALQLLCSVHRTLLGDGKTLSVIGFVPESVREAITLAGYKDCAPENDNSGLWKGVLN